MVVVVGLLALREGKDEPKRRFRLSREQPAPRVSDGWSGLTRPGGEDKDDDVEE